MAFSDKKIVAYYGSWKVYNTCGIDDIDPFVADVLVYAFAGIDATGVVTSLDRWADLHMHGYAKFNRLKRQNPRLKTLISVGGWNEGSTKFSYAASTTATRQKFAVSCADFVRAHGFDGVDLNWEYPCRRGGSAADKSNLIQLLAEIRRRFDSAGYLLTMAVAAGEAIASGSYDVPCTTRLLDAVFLMAYDYYTPSNACTGPNTPLDDVERSVKYWIRAGAEPGKLFLGTAGYGHTYTLSDATVHGPGANSVGPGVSGPITKTPGVLSYCEILDLEEGGWFRGRSREVPYLHRNDQWITYDDVTSIRKKVELAKKTGLRGMMFWSVDMDDVFGRHGRKFPLLNAIRDEFLNT